MQIDSVCPISNAPGDVECLYLDILRNIDIGIIVIDLAERTVIFKNGKSNPYLQHEDDFNKICSLLIPELLRDNTLNFDQLKRSIWINDRFLGYTIYLTGKSHISIFISDITANQSVS